MRAFSSIALLVFVSLWSMQGAQAQRLAIINGEIHTVSGLGVIDRGVVVVDNGRILAIGTNVAIPVGAQVIDAEGKHFCTTMAFNNNSL